MPTDPSRFFKVYDNLPIAIRNQVCVVLAGEPLTWNAASIEVRNKTSKMENILAKLAELGLI